MLMRCSNILCLFALPGRAGDGEVADPGNIHPLDACLLAPPSSQPSDEPTRRATQFLSLLIGSSRRVTIREACNTPALRLPVDLPAAELGKHRIWLESASVVLGSARHNSRRQSFAWTHLHTCAPHERRAMHDTFGGEAETGITSHFWPAPHSSWRKRTAYQYCLLRRSWRGTSEMGSRFI